MATAASCVSFASVGNLSLSAVPHGDGGRQVAKISATPSRSFLREARNLRMFPGTISMTAKIVMHAFDTDRGFGLNTDPAYKSRKSTFSFDNDDSFSFDNDRSKSYGSGVENTQSFNRNQGYGFNQRQSTESQGKKLFVGNLPWSADEQGLEGIFQEAGTVELVEVVYDNITGRSRGFAFVTMGSADEAEAAVSKLDGYSLGGRSIRVNISSGQKGGGSARSSSGGFSSGNPNPSGSSETGDSSKVFVGNLPWGVDDAALENMFNPYGEVVEARVLYDRNTGQSRGFGFVTLSSPSQASEAVSSLNGSDFDGRPLRVNLAEERPAPRF